MRSSLWAYRYTLTPKRRLSAVAAAGERHGALIRVGSGFADVHPWAELGDAPLERQLESLVSGDWTPLTRRSMAIAHADGAARERGVSLFDGLSIPLSHWSGDDPPPRFDTAKIKCGPNVDVARLPERVRLRLDFNASLTPAQFEAIAPRLPKERVEFVEDPCPYDEGSWTRLRSIAGIPLALDRGTGPAADVLVVKPAVQELPVDDREIVITSYMDHAVGQFGAVYVAAANSARVSSRCGLFTHELFERDEFFACIAADGARLLPPEGTGIGFDTLLERLPWKKLA